MSKINTVEVQKGFYFLIDNAPVEIVSVEPLIVFKWDGCVEVPAKISDLRPIKLNVNNLKCFGFEPDGWEIDENGDKHNTGSRGKINAMFRHKEKQKNGEWDNPLLIGQYHGGNYSIGGYMDIKYVHQMQMIMYILGNFKKIELDSIF